MRPGIVVIAPYPAEDDPSGMFEILENNTAYTLPLESGMEALLSCILIT